MTETAYEVRISVWNLDADNKDHEMTDVFEFPDKNKAYRSAQLWTDFYDICIRSAPHCRFGRIAQTAGTSPNDIKILSVFFPAVLDMADRLCYNK